MLKKFISMLLIITLLFCSVTTANANTTRSFTKEQQRIIDTIVEICSENWEKYGVLPSVCITQAFIESTLGEHCSGYNLWGINSGKESYSSLEAGVYRYLEVINNGYYDKALFCKNASIQIKHILDGGYCQPIGDYYEDALWTFETYDLTKYDKQMFKQIAKKKEKIKQQKIEKERLKKHRKEYVIEYDPSVPNHAIAVDISIIKKGAVCVFENHEMIGIYDVIDGSKGFVLKTSDLSLVGKTVKLKVCEEAKG